MVEEHALVQAQKVQYQRNLKQLLDKNEQLFSVPADRIIPLQKLSKEVNSTVAVMLNKKEVVSSVLYEKTNLLSDGLTNAFKENDGKDEVALLKKNIKKLEQEITDVLAKKEMMQRDIRTAEEKVVTIQKQYVTLESQHSNNKNNVYREDGVANTAKEKLVTNLQREQNQLKKQLQIERNAVEKKQQLVQDVLTKCMNVLVSPVEIEQDEEILHDMLIKLSTELDQFLPLPVEQVVREYASAKERTDFYEKELHDLERTEEKIDELIKKMREHLHVQYRNGLSKINDQFKVLVSRAFSGGEAQLQQIDVQHRNGEVSKGLDITINIPRKKIQFLSALSGGEKALVSLSLLFAIARISAPPFIVLDETDAALDEANSHRYGDLIEELSKQSQLIVVTHNRATMYRAHTLYGITMGNDGMSRLLSVDLADAEQVSS